MKKTLLFLLFISALFFGVSSQGYALTISEIEGNNSFASAQGIDPYFSLNSNPNVFGTLPTVSIHGSNEAASDVDYYSFTVASAGIGYFDIDDVTMRIINNVSYADLETTLSLFDSSHNLLAADVDTWNYPEDPGSISSFDSFLGVYTFTNPGIYYIAVSNQDNHPLSYGTLGGNLGRPDCALPACDPDNPWADFYNGGQYYLGNSGPTQVATTNGNWDSGTYTLHVTIANPVPEPSTAFLFGLGIIALLIISHSYILRPLFIQKRP